VWQVIRQTHNFWLSLEAYRDNIHSLVAFFNYNRNEDVWIVTSRTPTAGLTIANQTRVWLDRCGVNPTTSNYLGVIPVDDWNDKKHIYAAAGIEFSVDDKKETVEDCDTLKGHHAFLLDRPWNQDAKVKNRIKSLAAFFDAVVRLKSKA
jgi:hypothetical protein